MTQQEENAEGRAKGRGETVRRNRWPLALGAIGIAIFFFALGWFSLWMALGRNARNLLWAVKTAEKHFYRELSEDELYEEFFDAFTDALDPYSQYYAKKAYGEELDRTAGKSSGYGFNIWSGGEAPVAYAIKGNSPAERAGMRSGMYILAFGEAGEEPKAGSSASLVELLNEAETPVVLRCGYNLDGTDAKDCVLEYGAYRVSYCLYRDMGGSYRFDPTDLSKKSDLGDPLEGADADTAYIRLDRFYGTAAAEFEACLSLMKERGRKDLIIDLRGNGGGYIATFARIASHLLRDADEERPVVALTRYRDGTEETCRAPGNDFDRYFSEESAVYLLANSSSASASECLIGALISYNTLSYDKIFLERSGNAAKTYGKGIMQSTYTDALGNALKLTVAEIFWPNGKSIHGKGVTTEDGATALSAAVSPAGEDRALAEMLAALSQSV